MFKNAVKNFPLVIMHVPDQYKTQEMCDNVILENGGMLRFIPECYKNQKMCDKAVDCYSHASDLYSISIRHKMCDKGVNIYRTAIQIFSKMIKNSKNVWWSCWYLSFCIWFCSWPI